MKEKSLPYDFVSRRLHSLMGLWLSVFIIFHLLTNSQAALWFGDDGKGFIHDVNWIHDLPFLLLIEIALLAVPILIHLFFGIKYLFTAQYNSFGNTGHSPYLPEYGRNRAYTWQRITAWILAVGVIAHIGHMRVYEYPQVTKVGNKTYYMVKVEDDPGLYTLEKRIGFSIYNPDQIVKRTVAQKGEGAVEEQRYNQEIGFNEALKKKGAKEKEVIIVADNFGTTSLLTIRDTFKSPVMMALYTIFVLTACFHGFNGLWTAFIKWGITLSDRTQKMWLTFCQGLMVIVAALGLFAIFGTYWIN